MMNDSKDAASQAADSAWMKMIEDRLSDGSDRMDAMQAELAENTRVTREGAGTIAEVKDLLTTFKGALRFADIMGRVVIWFGKVAIACGTLYGMFYAATHGGKPPGGH